MLGFRMTPNPSRALFTWLHSSSYLATSVKPLSLLELGAGGWQRLRESPSVQRLHSACQSFNHSHTHTHTHTHTRLPPLAPVPQAGPPSLLGQVVPRPASPSCPLLEASLLPQRLDPRSCRTPTLGHLLCLNACSTQFNPYNA